MMLFSLACLLLLSNIKVAESVTKYNGKLIGQLTTKDHETRGTVYAVDEKHLKLIGFNYDGTAPDAFFWMGVKGQSNATVDGSGIIIPNEAGSTNKLRAYSNEDIVLTLPDKHKITDILWISVWCRLVGVNFGSITIPSNFVPPAPLDIGEFSRNAHQVRSGIVTIVDSRTFFIRDLYYDGNGPDAFFWVGTDRNDIHKGNKVPDENGRDGILQGYSGQDITIRLPPQYTVFDIDFLSMYCITATSNFGHVGMPANPNIPPYLSTSDMSLQNCEAVHDTMHVAWQVSGDEIIIELSGQLEPGQYMAFGLSGSESRTSMDDADVTVAWYTEGKQPKAVDYFMTSRSQCSNGVGVCPDTSQGGVNDATIVKSRQVDGVTVIQYRRKLNTNDPKDLVFRTDKEQYLAWAIGPINPDGLAQKHTLRVSSNLKWNFGRTAAKNCPDFVPKKLPDVTGFKEQKIVGSDVNNEFTVEIGQSGGRRGYEAITGRASWGIAFYINNLLIPVLYLKRGETYKFTIKSGNNTSNLAEYHPFYITDDPDGGYAQCGGSGKCDAKLYAGIGADGKPTADAVGPLCEWESKTTDQSSSAKTFAEYFKTLKRTCKPGNPGVLTWTPGKDVPDTVYYQCYQHRYLGWKIRFTDINSSSTVHFSIVLFTVTSLAWLLG